ncbi:hypothetical protein KM043_012231 [Ampulex compressa]|nr:hypothetical protein KM043_012231 [Ampulex compressa]
MKRDREGGRWAEVAGARFEASPRQGRRRVGERYSGRNRARAVGGLRYPRDDAPSPGSLVFPFFRDRRGLLRAGMDEGSLPGLDPRRDKNVKQKADYVTEG